MQTEAASSPARRVITSPSRAAQIVELVAAKHDLPVHTVMCARWDRYAIAARAEVAYELKHRLRWSLRRIGAFLGCSHQNVCQLFTCHDLNMRRAKRWLPLSDLHALIAVREDDRLSRAFDAEERAQYAEAELRRLTGEALALRFAEALSLRMRGAIMLAIVAEAYPRVVLGSEMVEHYDAACERLDYGDRRGANFNLLTKNVAYLRAHFEAHGWPCPIIANDALTPREMNGARRLTDKAATFLHERLDAPRASQLEAAHERRSSRVPASRVRAA